MFIVVVDFHIYPEQTNSFLADMRANAKASVELEPHCVQFDVCVSKSDPNHVFLYEVYRSEVDFSDHLKMPHFLAFNAKTSLQVKEKTICTFERLSVSA